MFGINKILLVGGGIAVVLLLSRKGFFNKQKQQIVSNDNCSQKIDEIRNRMHDFLKQKFPNADDVKISNDVLLLTSNF